MSPVHRPSALRVLTVPGDGRALLALDCSCDWHTVMSSWFAAGVSWARHVEGAGEGEGVGDGSCLLCGPDPCVAHYALRELLS